MRGFNAITSKIELTALSSPKSLQPSQVELQAKTLGLLRLLDPNDFETLGGLIFETSGWRRISTVGGNQKTTDIDLLLPTTGEKALVQIKSSTTQAEFQSYLDEFKRLRRDFSWLFICITQDQ
ncbi:MAG TPA: hypothetical protein VN682_20325 [Terriglobales bacterium]|nr:hypothetical protein [Terriglobales bacterium]